MVLTDSTAAEITRTLTERFGYSAEMIGTGGGCTAILAPLTGAGEHGPHYIITDGDAGTDWDGLYWGPEGPSFLAVRYCGQEDCEGHEMVSGSLPTPFSARTRAGIVAAAIVGR